MAKAESTIDSSLPALNIEFMRSLVKQYSELGQWTSALFWADAAAAAGASVGGGAPSGDDVWLLASTMLARGELHRAAYAVTSRGLHRRHLLCLGVAMRAYVAAKEPAPALALMDECDPILLEANTDQTHNRALAGVLVTQARALAALERRDAAAAALSAALAADTACVEAIDALLHQHALTAHQESELINSLPINQQLGPAEGALLRAAYKDRLLRHTPADKQTDTHDQLSPEVETARGGSADARMSRARRLAAACRWASALGLLDSVDPWCCADVRVACLVELKKSSQLFAFAHTLVDAYPNSWQAWYAVGCYYYLIGKSEFARRYLSKAKSLEPGAGCVWLAYGHSFAADSEHDQAMAAYFKAMAAYFKVSLPQLAQICVWLAYGHSFAADSEHDQAMAAYFKAHQLMAGCAVPPLYVGVQCLLLNNTATCERFLLRAAQLFNDQTANDTVDDENKSGWERIAAIVKEPSVAHEAGCCALAAGMPAAATRLLLKALDAQGGRDQVNARWAPTLDALGHSCRRLGHPQDALEWHERALALRPGRASTYAAMGLCLALLGRETEAADALHSALAKDPDDVVSLALLDAIVDRLDAALTEEEIPQFPFPAVNLSLPPRTPTREGLVGVTVGVPGGGEGGDVTNTSDMSMSFD